VSFEAARLALSRIEIDSDEAYRRAVRNATEVSARALGVARVGVWYLRGDRLEPTHLYTLATGEHAAPDPEAAIDLSAAPAYAAALRERRVIVAHDVATDPVTAGLAAYCAPLGITSLLDAPFYFQGRIGGVICHEHVGPPRVWTDAEVSLACTVADMAAVICGQAQLLAAQAELRDLTSRRIDQARVDTLGQLASALGHEIGNLLHVIQLGMARIKASTDPQIVELAPTLTHAVDLATRLFDGMRRFGHARAGGAHTSVNAVLTQLRPLLELLVRGVATIDLELAADDSRVAIRDGDLQQVILNLVTNARAALAVAGRAGTIAIRVATRPDGTAITVRDDGPGVPTALADTLFEPYVTGRETGTGLGLWLVRQMVEEVGGLIQLESTLGGGATFRIDLPTVPRS
jgi:nitrogen-specific signal transduction histidine kinase